MNGMHRRNSWTSQSSTSTTTTYVPFDHDKKCAKSFLNAFEQRYNMLSQRENTHVIPQFSCICSSFPSTDNFSTSYGHPQRKNSLIMEMNYMTCVTYRIVLNTLKYCSQFFTKSLSPSQKDETLQVAKNKLPDQHPRHIHDGFRRIRVAWNESNDAKNFIHARHDENINHKDMVYHRRSRDTSGGKNQSNIIARETQSILRVRHLEQRKRNGNGLLVSAKMVPEFDISESVSLMKYLSPCIGPDLCVLELIGFKLSIHSTDILSKALSSCKSSLRVLSLKDTQLGDRAFESIGRDMLIQCTQLQKIQLSGCKLTNKSGLLLLPVVKAAQERKGMSVWQSSLRQHGSNSTPTTPFNDHGILESLDLSRNYLTDEFVIAFCSIMYDNDCLRSIDLSHNVIYQDGIEASIRLLFNDQEYGKNLIEYFDLSGNGGIEEYKMRNDHPFSTKALFSIESFVYLGRKQCKGRRKKSKNLFLKSKQKVSKRSKKHKKRYVSNLEGEDMYEDNYGEGVVGSGKRSHDHKDDDDDNVFGGGGSGDDDDDDGRDEEEMGGSVVLYNEELLKLKIENEKLKRYIRKQEELMNQAAEKQKKEVSNMEQTFQELARSVNLISKNVGVAGAPEALQKGLSVPEYPTHRRNVSSGGISSGSHGSDVVAGQEVHLMRDVSTSHRHSEEGETSRMGIISEDTLPQPYKKAITEQKRATNPIANRLLEIWNAKIAT